MEKQQRLVVVVCSKHHATAAVHVLDVVNDETEALDIFYKIWGDGYGATPYMVDVIKDCYEFYVPVNLEYQTPLTTEFANQGDF